MANRAGSAPKETVLSAVDQSFGPAGEAAGNASRLRRRLLSGFIYLLLTIVAIAVVVPQFLGRDKDQVVPLLQNVRVEYLALAVLVEIVRYTCFGLVARRLAYGLGHPLRRRDAVQMMLASYSLARILSAGGATAFLVRVQFYLRQGLTVGRTLALFIAQNVVSSGALLLTYVFGVGVLWQHGDLAGVRAAAAIAWFFLAFTLAAVQVAVGLWPGFLEQRVQRAMDFARSHGHLLTRWSVPAGIVLSLTLAALSALWLSGASQLTEQIMASGVIAMGVLSAALLASTLLSARLSMVYHRQVGTRLQSALHGRLAQRDVSQNFARDLSEGVRHALGERRTMLTAFALQATGLAADISALVIAFQALHVPAPVPLIVAAYIIAYYAQLIAPTPGEAGAMEFALLGVLVGLGISPLNATTTTLFYRFVSFWLPIPFGVLGYFNLKRESKV
jgi:uncharacterized membrane protein YbhN (UPF0104 family)